MMSDSIFGLLPRSTWTIRCAMRSTVVACGVTDTLAGSFSMWRASSAMSCRHGGREQQRLPLRRELGDDLTDVADEAHVEHAVGFVEHEHLDFAETNRVALDQIEQAARRGDQHVDAVRQRADLRSHVDAADGERGLDAQVPAVGAEAVEDLAGEFAGRAQHQHAAGLGLRADAVGGERG